MAKDGFGEPEQREEPEHEAIQADPVPIDSPPPGERGQGRPGRQRGVDDSFTGRAAQLAVMAELLRLRCNTAIPEVDVGTDVFVFKDDQEAIVRLQVKACTVPRAYADGAGYSAKFALPMKQLRRLNDRPPFYYALAVLREDRWADFLIVSRARLQSYYNGDRPFGSLNKKSDDLEITVEFRTKVECSGRDLTDCRNAWQSLPPLRPTPGPEPVVRDEAKAAGPADTGHAPPEDPGQT